MNNNKNTHPFKQINNEHDDNNIYRYRIYIPVQYKTKPQYNTMQYKYINLPAGKLNTPAPTILFTKLNISFGMDAVPVPLTPPTLAPLVLLLSSGSIAAASAICNAEL